MSGKRGRRPTPEITAAMYIDYCTGLTADEVGQKWAVGGPAVYRRFAQMGLPLHERRPCRCRQADRNPHEVSGVAFDTANAERSRAARQKMCARAKSVLPHVKNEYARGVLQLRISHPDATLAELAAMHAPPLSKNAVAAVLHRARKVSA
jgi:hypothetical protein